MTDGANEAHPKRWSPGWITAWIAIVSTAIGAALPLATFVRESQAKKRELAVAEAQQQFAFRSAYLDRALDPAKPPELRQGVFRFLVATTADEPMKKWAMSELANVTEDVNRIRAERDDALSKAAASGKDLAAKTEALAREQRARKVDASAIAAAQREIAELRRAKAELEAKAAKAEQRLTGRVYDEKVGERVNLEARIGAAETLKGAPVMGTATGFAGPGK